MDGETALHILVLVGVLAAGYVTVLKFSEDRRVRDLALWLRERHPVRWDALPWVLRNADRLGAVENFRRDPSFENAEFDRRYANIKVTRRQQAIGIAVAGTCFALAILGHQVLGWRV